MIYSGAKTALVGIWVYFILYLKEVACGDSDL